MRAGCGGGPALAPLRHRPHPAHRLERFAASLHQLRLAREEERSLLRACVQSGLTGYRLARRERAQDRDRFAAFVNGVSDACTDRTQRALLARALSERQRRHLADRLDALPGHA